MGCRPARSGAPEALTIDRTDLDAPSFVVLGDTGEGDESQFSQYFDWNEPPMFRSFLRLDATSEALRIRCFAATGCAEHDATPPLEDEALIPLDA